MLHCMSRFVKKNMFTKDYIRLPHALFRECFLQSSGLSFEIANSVFLLHFTNCNSVILTLSPGSSSAGREDWSSPTPSGGNEGVTQQHCAGILTSSPEKTIVFPQIQVLHIVFLVVFAINAWCDFDTPDLIPCNPEWLGIHRTSPKKVTSLPAHIY